MSLETIILGHGKSVQSKSEYGFFNEKYGNACVIGDMHTLRQRTMKKYPDVPYFHVRAQHGLKSLLRQYVQMYGNGLSGSNVYRSRSRSAEERTLQFGKRIVQDYWRCSVAGIIEAGWWTGWRVGAYNRKFKNRQRRRADWVTSDRRTSGKICFRSTVLLCLYSERVL